MPTFFTYGTCGALALLDIHIGDHHPCPFGRQPPGSRRADPLRSPADDDATTGESPTGALSRSR
ncbi:hypothetical protein [Streptomyces sp. NPDC058268]|uniref:hypothetical protein n=1 Tax=Streptomyces sp. NPDC058268 TaxID=3346413 RepID=UPI0036F016B1